MVTQGMTQEDAQADGIVRFLLARGYGSRKQIAWLKGYIRRLRDKVRPQDKS